jgi:uncharacterized protein YchJ
MLRGYIKGVKSAAEKLMRSRYSAYAGRNRIIWSQQHILMREYHSKEDILWARSNDWQKLEVLRALTVEFKAYF